MFSVKIPRGASLRSPKDVNRQRSIRVPIGMTDIVILFGNTESKAFRKAVRKAMS